MSRLRGGWARSSAIAALLALATLGGHRAGAAASGVESHPHAANALPAGPATTFVADRLWVV
jgi:hypothetical protein